MNRWVGIVSLREIAAPTPVHRIGLAIEAARRRTSYSLGGRQVSYGWMRSALRRVGQTYAGRSEWDRWSYCVDLAGDFFDGGGPTGELPGWVTAELRGLLGDGSEKAGGRRRQRLPEPARPERRDTGPARSRKTAPAPSGRPPAPRKAPAGQRAATEPPQAYVRAVRQLAVRDVVHAPPVTPPAALVGTHGESVLRAIREAVGAWDPEAGTAAWLGLAATHRSGLYESGLIQTTMTPHVLGVLDRLGGSTLDVILIDGWVREWQPQKVGVQASEHSRRKQAARRVLGLWAAAHGLVRMGAGEAQRPAASVAEAVARQILGALSLTGAHDTARLLVEAVCADLGGFADDRAGGADPVTEAQTVFAAEGLAYAYTEEGPDHEKTFTATARTRTGLSARGTGRSKKEARVAASRALLRGRPRATRPDGARPSETRLAASPRPYQSRGLAYREAVTDMTAMFELDGRRAEGMLAQALTHVSYAYENQAEVAAHQQRDNQLLAHHGSFVLDHLSRHARACRVLSQSLVPDEDEARIQTPANEDTQRLGTELALFGAVLTGRGENGRKPSLIADAAQAIVATAWRVHGPALLQRRPALLDDWLTALQHRRDPVTEMQGRAALFGMTASYEHEETGPDHLRTYASTLVLRDVRGRVHRWTVAPDGPCSKTEADKTTAQDVLDILAAPADGDETEALAPVEAELLRYLLRAQLDGLATTNERQRARMAGAGLLGADLLATGDLDAFHAWAGRAQTALGGDGVAVPDALRELYRQILSDTRFGPRSLLRRMEAEQGSGPASAVRRHAAEAVLRAARRGPWGVTVRDVVQDWWRDQAPLTDVTVRDDMRRHLFLPLPVQLAALDETLSWCGEAAEAADTRVDVELTVRDGTLHVWIGLNEIDARAACGDFARLLSRTLPRTDCIVDDDHVLLRLHGRPDAETLSPLAEAGLDAYLTTGAPSPAVRGHALEETNTVGRSGTA
ncbi:putative dsRNA-binding protein [Streptomyces hydrogenans]|uniref:putative dsRNA-binding protein n=1 Tax=Streptomyces hydrogenans TaxID=1873719 RepID=UPI003805A402